MAILALITEKSFWQDVYNNLAERDIFITHVVAKYHPDVSTMSYFKKHKVKALDTIKFFKLETISELTKTNTVVLDKKIIDYFEKVERDFYILVDRMNYIPRSFRYKKRLFRESIRFWLSYLAEEKIELVFSSCTPHDLSSYVAFHAAKYLEIPTMYLAYTMINDYVTVDSDYRNERRVPPAFLEGLSAEEVIAKIPEKLLVRAMGKNLFLEYSKFLNAQSLSGENKIHMRDNSLEKNLVTLDEIAYMGLTDYRKDASLLYMDKKISGVARKFLKKYDTRRMAKLRRQYEALTTKPDFGQKYIYYSMHMQPERTATPEAEIFEDQLMAIDILSKSAPEGWLIYVKEHPTQFHLKLNLFKGAHMRDLSDYDDILRCKNVRLVSCEVPSNDLVANSQLVATLSGSVGWETLQAGKACIAFSNSWYGACRSIMRVGTVAECRAAIAKLVTHDKEIVHLNLLKYLAYMNDKIIIGNLGDQALIEAITMPYNEHVASVTDVIERQYRAHR